MITLAEIRAVYQPSVAPQVTLIIQACFAAATMTHEKLVREDWTDPLTDEARDALVGFLSPGGAAPTPMVNARQCAKAT